MNQEALESNFTLKLLKNKSGNTNPDLSLLKKHVERRVEGNEKR